MATPNTLPPQTSSGTTTQAMPPVAQPTTTPKNGGASGSWGDPVPAPVVPPTAVPQTPPAVVTAKPAVQNIQKQKAVITEKTYSAQAQQQANDAALAAKNAADAARAATGGLTPEQNAAKIKEMQASAVAQSSQATKTNPDGNLVSYDGGSSWSPNTSGATAPTAGSSTTSTSPQAPIPSSSFQTPEQKTAAAIQASDLKMQTAYDEHKAKIDQIINGTYPLTDDQKSQLNNIAVQFTSLINSQKLANANYEQSLRVAGISSGRSMYAPEIELGNIKGAMDEGLAKIADIDMKMQTTLINARQAIKDDNVKLLSSSYKDLMDFETAKRQSINDLYSLSTKEIENAKQTYKAAQEEAESYAALSKDPSTFSPDFFSKMDKQREQVGLPTYEGYSQDIYKLQYDLVAKDNAAKAAKTAAETAAAETKQALDLISIFDKTGMKGDLTVGGHTYTYQGTNPADVASGTETDEKGNLVAWTLNKRTGATKTYNLGISKGVDTTTIKGEDGRYYAYDPATKTATPIFVSDGRSAWDNGPLATGQTGPALPGHEANAGQCGALVNAMYGKAVIGNDLQTGKLDVLAPYKVEFSPTNSANIQAGMTFVQAIGGKNGHIGFVESVGKDPVTGRAFITTFDSNRSSDGKIQHGRQIYLDDPTLKMIADHPTPNLPAFGPDTPPTQLGSAPASGKTLTDKQIKAVESSPEAKQLIALKDLKNKIGAYKDVVTNLDSFAAVGADAAKVDALYAAAQIAWKEAAALGALTGPDLDLIYKALKPMSGVANYVSYKSGGGKEGVMASLDAGLETLNTSGDTKSKTLLSKYGEFKDDPYILDLTEGFKAPAKDTEAPPTPPALPSDYSNQLKTARAAKVSDDVSLATMLKHFPAYQSLVDAAKANNLTSTEILNSLAK